MNALTTLANMLGIAPRLAEDALHSESAARAVLTRRNLFAVESLCREAAERDRAEEQVDG